MFLLLAKALVSGGLIVTISELAKRNNAAASIVHSLPLVSLLALIWLYSETRDTALIARHAQGTFWFVLPTLPLFLALPWLLRRGWDFWPALGLCAPGRRSPNAESAVAALCRCLRKILHAGSDGARSARLPRAAAAPRWRMGRVGIVRSC
ncbi:MAG TPA: DUF3147 family protein [Chthoniobacteraceae bacterium]|jgi:uncharacterized membrane protein (GlpM family)